MSETILETIHSLEIKEIKCLNRQKLTPNSQSQNRMFKWTESYLKVSWSSIPEVEKHSCIFDPFKLEKEQRCHMENRRP